MTASTVTSDAARTAPDRPPVVERSRRAWLWAGLLTATLAAPVLWVTLSRHYTNGSDWASIEMRTRDVFSAHPPVVGAYSRMGWSHPGPLLFYLLAVPYRLFGQDAQAMQLGAILVNVVVIALIVWLLSDAAGRRWWPAAWRSPPPCGASRLTPWETRGTPRSRSSRSS